VGVTKRKRKKNPFQAEVYLAGEMVASEVFPTRSAAWAWHEKTKRKLQAGHLPAQEMTLLDVIDVYRETDDFQGHVALTRRTFNDRIKLIEESPLAHVKMEDLSSKSIDRLLDWLLKQPGAKNPQRKSFDMELKQLGIVFTYYRDYQDEHFVSPITKRHRKRSKFKGVQPRRSDYFLPPDHIALWLEALLQEMDPVYYRLAVMQLIFGLRVSEAAALQWDAVDLERKLLEVKRVMEWDDEDGKNKREIQNRTKTPSSRRTLPIPSSALFVLKAARDSFPDSLVVFRNVYGKLVAYNSVLQAYNRAFKRAELPWTSTHITRHTNGTHGLSAGKAAVQVNLGHASDRETEVYAKVQAVTANVVPEIVGALIAKIHHVQTHVHSARQRKKAGNSKGLK
jgi:integrase